MAEIEVPLPLELRPSFLSMCAASLGLLMFSMAFCVAVMIVRNGYPGFPITFFGSLAAFGFGTGALTCMTVYRHRISIDERRILKVDIRPRHIPLNSIKSWHYHPATRVVHLTTDDDGHFPLSNWSISRENGILIGRVLQQKIGPPGGSGQSSD